MINRKIAISAISILSALALVGGATYAFFSSSSSSNSNIFAAGSIDLQLDDNDESFAASVSASLGSLSLAPGASTSGFISLHNNGTLPIAEVEFGANQTSNSNGGDGSDLANVLNLTVFTGTDSTCSTGAVDQTPAMTTALGDTSSPLTLMELVTTDYDALPGLAASGTYFLCVTATMDSGAGNEYQGDSKTLDFVFTGNQDVSQ